MAVLVGLAGAACTTTRAAAPVERPTLEVPPPPPRVVVPLPVPQPNQLEPVADLGTATPTFAKPRRDNPAHKAEPKPEDPKPAEPPPAAPPVQQPVAAPQLRLPENSGSPQASQIEEVISRARAILNNVDFVPLPAAAKKAYKESQMFANQAENELKTNNLAIAKEFADKAESLAKGLQGRRIFSSPSFK